MKPPVRRRQKLSDLIVEEVKRSIVMEQLKPGDRLPQEKELMERFGCSKGTVREALKALEVEGLVIMRTGPSGGAYLCEVDMEPASRALRNYLHFNHVNGAQVYQLRRIIEVEIAVAVIGRLNEEDFQELERNIEFCSLPLTSEAQQRAQRIAEIEFHNLLAERCANPLLGFMSRFMNDMLRDLVVLKKAYLPSRDAFGESNVNYHQALLQAWRVKDEAAVRQLMHEHMCDAEQHMTALEGEMARHVLLDFARVSQIV
ncbi:MULTISPECIES: FadR/GntR family transcriptional regulator [unclassified Pseudomonas]|uniref:FadR/GntR family transcriptional regulator n=1 Tax=unclassified Pseudomonas TaxID=196821 RepID=UPI00257CB00F|nr:MULTISPECIES: FCD domain-containing protein [unclassified Pseudomonas]